MKARSTLVIAALALAGCASTVYNLSNPSLMLAGTPGEYFRQFQIKRDAECREKKLGPYMPADIPPNSPLRGNAGCSDLFLKPWQPGDSPESAYAHSLKLPPPHDKPVDVYKPGMSPQEYFEALCKAQAGEFIFRRVEGVEGIVELRPRAPESSEMNRHLTAFEDPATYAHWQDQTTISMTFGKPYQFLERYRLDGGVDHYVGDLSEGRLQSRMTRLQSAKSNIGFTWRGIYNQTQLELGIAGGEFLVIDLSTKEVLGFKRSFVYRWLGRFPNDQRISATGFERVAEYCPVDKERLISRRYSDFRDFVVLVANPILTDSGSKN